MACLFLWILPGQSTGTCPRAAEDGVHICCLRWWETPGAGGCGMLRVCVRAEATLVGAPRGVRIEAGGRYNLTVAAETTSTTMAPTAASAAHVMVLAGTARDMWGRLAAHCTAHGNGTLSPGVKEWCYWNSAAPGVVAAFGAATAPNVDRDECVEQIDNCQPRVCIPTASPWPPVCAAA